MSGITLKIEGVDALVKKFDGMPEASIKKLFTAFKVASLKIQSDAQAIVPVDTGRLKLSIQSRVERKGDAVGAEIWSGAESEEGKPVDYAAFVEFGTSKMKAQPYMRPAMDKNKAQLIKQLEQVLKV